MLNIYPIAFRAVSGLAEPITVQRRPETRGADGVVRVGPVTTYQARAIVIDTPPNDLQRGADFQTAQNSIEVSTTFPLRGPAPGYQPDQVVWHGDVYVVTSVLDYSKAGRGFVTALCQSVDLIDSPPMTP